MLLVKVIFIFFVDFCVFLIGFIGFGRFFIFRYKIRFYVLFIEIGKNRFRVGGGICG